MESDLFFPVTTVFGGGVFKEVIKVKMRSFEWANPMTGVLKRRVD